MSRMMEAETEIEKRTNRKALFQSLAAEEFDRGTRLRKRSEPSTFAFVMLIMTHLHLDISPFRFHLRFCLRFCLRLGRVSGRYKTGLSKMWRRKHKRKLLDGNMFVFCKQVFGRHKMGRIMTACSNLVVYRFQ